MNISETLFLLSCICSFAYSFDYGGRGRRINDRARHKQELNQKKNLIESKSLWLKRVSLGEASAVAQVRVKKGYRM